MAKNICCRIQHIQKRIEAQKNGGCQRWKSVAQINEQSCI